MKRWFLIVLSFLLVILVIRILAHRDSEDTRTVALKLLKSGAIGIHEFNLWRQKEPQINLSKSDLSGIDLREANLS